MCCSVCALHPTTVGHLCRACHCKLTTVLQADPRKIATCGVLHSVCAMLFDSWGRRHALGARNVLGRLPQGPGLAMHDASISRHHAHLIHEPTSNMWFLRDLGSRNGTTVNNMRIEAPVPIASGDCIGLGVLRFFFVAQAKPSSERAPARIPAGVAKPSEYGERHRFAAAPTQIDTAPSLARAGSPTLELSFAQPTGGGGAVLTIAGRKIQLSPIQYMFLHTLASRMQAEHSQPASVRGFIRTTELAAVLPWGTATPNEQHVKQLVRRIRRILDNANVGNLIESRPRFGYRLCV